MHGAKPSGTVPKWNGGRMPLSSALAHEVERVFDGARRAPEMQAIARLLDLQDHLSALPAPDRLLVEWVQARGGRLTIEWDGGAGDSVRMTGPAETVFEGSVELPDHL